MHKWIFGILILLSPLSVAWGQGSKVHDIAWSPRGPVPFASVAVCTEPATTTIAPCTPLATLYTNLTLTTTTPNPITADILGNFSFYAAPGHYTVQIYGSNVAVPYVLTDVILPCDPSSTCTGVIGSVLAANVVPGTFANGGYTFPAALTVQGAFNAASAVFSQPLTGPRLNGFYYVDGVTYTTLKQAVVAAVAAGGGTIFDSMPETFTSNPFPVAGNTAPIMIYFSPGLWRTNVALSMGEPVILQGAGGGTVSGTTIQAVSGTFPTSTPVITFANAGSGVFNSRLMDMDIDCANITGCTGIYSTELNENSGGRDIGVFNFCTYGINIDASANSGGSPPNPAAHYFFEKLSLLPSSTCSSNSTTIGGRFKGNGADGPWAVRDVSVVGSQQFLAGVWMDNMQNGIFSSLNVEGAVNGAMFGTVGINGVIIQNLETGSGATTDTFNFNGIGNQITLMGLYKGVATHLVNDSLRHVLLTDNYIPLYAVGDANFVVTSASVPTTVAQLPSAASASGQPPRVVNDSTTVSAEGQTCVGSSSNVALAFSNGSVWKCF